MLYIVRSVRWAKSPKGNTSKYHYEGPNKAKAMRVYYEVHAACAANVGVASTVTMTEAPEGSPFRVHVLSQDFYTE